MQRPQSLQESFRDTGLEIEAKDLVMKRLNRQALGRLQVRPGQGPFSGTFGF